MPKMTDHVRAGFKRRRRPWEAVELPEWWTLAIWAGLAGVVVALVVSGLAARGGSGGATAGAGAVRYTIQPVNPHRVAPTREAASPEAAGADAPPGPSQAPRVPSHGDFGATAPVRVPRTGGGMATIPAGAWNLALAAARAAATGDWTGVPVRGDAGGVVKSPEGSVVGTVTVEDPAVTGPGLHRFSATITHGPAEPPYRVAIDVERDRSGFVASRTPQETGRP
ncbi:hypothetical protein [Actinomadura sp. SCN-SB]|uniref:hypothetical protein n=1 Tax=Actinomadura sp. SCN-SB TaxID=3373092 RepID=UPI003753AAFD